MYNNQWSYICGYLTEGQDRFVENFLREAVIKEFPGKVHMIRQGEESSYLYLILNGYLETYLLMEDGRKKTNMIFTSTSVVGVSCLDEPVSRVNLRCLSRVKAAAVHKSTVLSWPPDMLLSLAMLQTLKMQGVYRQLREQAFLSVEEQILKFLRDWRESGISEMQTGIKGINRQLLADSLGISRVQAVNTLNRMLQQGKIPEEAKEFL